VSTPGKALRRSSYARGKVGVGAQPHPSAAAR